MASWKSFRKTWLASLALKPRPQTTARSTSLCTLSSGHFHWSGGFWWWGEGEGRRRGDNVCAECRWCCVACLSWKICQWYKTGATLSGLEAEIIIIQTFHIFSQSCKNFLPKWSNHSLVSFSCPPFVSQSPLRRQHQMRPPLPLPPPSMRVPLNHAI